MLNLLWIIPVTIVGLLLLVAIAGIVGRALWGPPRTPRPVSTKVRRVELESYIARLDRLREQEKIKDAVWAHERDEAMEKLSLVRRAWFDTGPRMP